MKNGKSVVVILLLLLLASTGCKRTQEDYVGPGLGYATKDFAVISNLTVSADSIDFKKNSKVDFSARFNEKVSYSITVTGTVSGGIKHIKGFSDHIAVSWIGNSELIFFRNEMCIVELTVLGAQNVISKRSVYITETYNPEGTMVANMESGGITCSNGFWNPWVPKIKTKGGNDSTEQIYSAKITGMVPSLEGISQWKLEGLDLTGSGYVGQSVINASAKNGINYYQAQYYYKTGTSNPDSLWFNIFIYGTGDENAATYIKLLQDDNGDGIADNNTENGFEQKILDLSHKGWKLFSFRYSSILLGGNSSFGGSGDNIHRPNKIARIEFALWSLHKGADVSLIYDYPVFTVGKPFGQ